MSSIAPTITETIAVELPRRALVDLLGRAKHIVPARFPKPVLTCVRLDAHDGFLHVQGTDGETSLFTQMPAEGDLSACVVPLAELLRRLKASKCPSCSLALAENGARLHVNGGRVEHSLETYDVTDFPIVPSQLTGDSIEVEATEFVHALDVTGHAVAKEPSRYAINGVLLESNEKGSRLVATDGRRMVLADLRQADVLNDQVIMPQRCCTLIQKLTARDADFLAVAVHREKTDKGEALPARLSVAGPDWVLSTFECEGNFPIYQDVIPGSHSKFVLDRQRLLETLSEVALTTTLDSRMIRLDLEASTLRLSAEAPGVARSEATLPTEFLGGGDAEIHTAFNPGYLLDALKSLTGDTIVFDVDQNGYGCDRSVFAKPALVYDRHDAAVRWLLMPLNAGLEATRANLGSNYPEHFEEKQDQPTPTSATEAA